MGTMTSAELLCLSRSVNAQCPQSRSHSILCSHKNVPFAASHWWYLDSRFPVHIQRISWSIQSFPYPSSLPTLQIIRVFEGRFRRVQFLIGCRRSAGRTSPPLGPSKGARPIQTQAQVHRCLWPVRKALESLKYWILQFRRGQSRG